MERILWGEEGPSASDNQFANLKATLCTFGMRDDPKVGAPVKPVMDAIECDLPAMQRYYHPMESWNSIPTTLQPAHSLQIVCHGSQQRLEFPKESPSALHIASAVDNLQSSSLVFTVCHSFLLAVDVLLESNPRLELIVCYQNEARLEFAKHFVTYFYSALLTSPRPADAAKEAIRKVSMLVGVEDGEMCILWKARPLIPPRLGLLEPVASLREFALKEWTCKDGHVIAYLAKCDKGSKSIPRKNTPDRVIYRDSTFYFFSRMKTFAQAYDASLNPTSYIPPLPDFRLLGVHKEFSAGDYVLVKCPGDEPLNLEALKKEGFVLQGCARAGKPGDRFLYCEFSITKNVGWPSDFLAWKGLLEYWKASTAIRSNFSHILLEAGKRAQPQEATWASWWGAIGPALKRRVERGIAYRLHVAASAGVLLAAGPLPLPLPARPSAPLAVNDLDPSLFCWAASNLSRTQLALTVRDKDSAPLVPEWKGSKSPDSLVVFGTVPEVYHCRFYLSFESTLTPWREKPPARQAAEGTWSFAFGYKPGSESSIQRWADVSTDPDFFCSLFEASPSAGNPEKISKLGVVQVAVPSAANGFLTFKSTQPPLTFPLESENGLLSWRMSLNSRVVLVVDGQLEVAFGLDQSTPYPVLKLEDPQQQSGRLASVQASWGGPVLDKALSGKKMELAEYYELVKPLDLS